ncbi:hypothetical protein THAOC_27105, partial [Thalassiosira oceanica]
MGGQPVGWELVDGGHYSAGYRVIDAWPRGEMEPADEVAEPSQGDVAAEPRRQRVSSGPSYEDVLGAVDEIYHDIEDPGLATVGDVKRHVAKRFGWEKCSEFMSKLIKHRLTDLVNGNGDPDEVTTPKERKTDTCTKDEPPRPMSP